jgi:hypothetical protein
MNKRGQDLEEIGEVKFVKTGELQKSLICSIIGVAVHLAHNRRLWGSVLAKLLKKQQGDLKNFIKELGFVVEAIKNEKTNEQDLLIHASSPKVKREKGEAMKKDIEEAREEARQKRERAMSKHN